MESPAETSLGLETKAGYADADQLYLARPLMYCTFLFKKIDTIKSPSASPCYS